MRKRILSILLAALMVVSLLPTVALATETAGLDNFKEVQSYTDGKFTDVKADDWFEKNVSSAYELNLMVGRRSDFFDTDNYLTVAEAMTIAARLRSIYYTGKAEFEQGNPWYQACADYCKANGVADPADYNMNKAITRGEFAEIFAKALPADALKKINTVQDNMIPEVKKADKFSAAIYLLYRAGILVGNDAKGTFSPDTNIKRVEVAAITTRMAQPALRESIRLVKPSSGGGSYTPPAPTTYTVTFDMNGHGDPISQMTNVTYGATIDKPTAPTATGCAFQGWYKESSCTNEWKFDTDTVAADTTLYAKWLSRGDIIILNKDSEHGYRILSAEGSKAFVVSMYNVSESAIAYDADKTTSETGLIKYAESDIDNYLENTWYAGLDSTMKGAIEETTIDQPAYNQALEQPSGTEGEDYYKVTYGGSNIEYIVPQSGKKVTVGKRHVYLLDVMDVVNYFGTGNLTQVNVNETFFNNEPTTSRCWLRSSTDNTDCAAYAWYIYGTDGKFDIMPGDNSLSNAVEARAAFTIDLSKVDYDIVSRLYTVTFDLNGIGSAIVPQTVVEDGKVKKPTDPTDEVHTFAGWYKDSGYTIEWDFENNAITKDTTLYAKWTRTLGSILNTVQDFPNTTGSAVSGAIPTTAWVKIIDNTYKGYIASKGNSMEILALKGGSGNPFSCKTSNLFTKIGNKYVFEYKHIQNDTPLGLFTMNMTEDGELTSIVYEGEGTDYAAFSGTYTAPASN